MENLKPLTEAALAAVAQAEQLRELDDIRVQYLGKKGEISALLKTLGKLSPDERPKAGAVINEARDQVQAAIEARKHYCRETRPVDTIMAINRFVNPEWLVEIEVDAVIQDRA